MMKEQLDKIEQDIDDVKKALLGDEFGNEGYMHRLEKAEKHIEDNKKRLWVERGILISLSAVWALVVKFWHNIFG